jgi:LPXTG-motif cell wall-anchored protein
LGETVNASLVSGLNNLPYAIAASQAVPEPTTLTLWGSAMAGLGVVYLRRRRPKV